MIDLMKWIPKQSSSQMIPTEGRPNPQMWEIDPESWQVAEQATDEVLHRIMPTVAAQERRKHIILYFQRLLRNAFGLEAFPFGSVPLRTYLPDGDIDLTTFPGPNCKEIPVEEVRSLLEAEQNNKDAEFELKDVRIIDAEVQIIKCRIKHIVIDISFSQIGGICALCFLEQVDQIIGKNHLFKRSITLIKAWCYYESRILGAYHGLISTYGVEILVLYILNLFHASLDGPLAVLYRFLDYYGKFNWEKYGISLEGPFKLSFLPEVLGEPAEINGGCPLLTETILQGHRNVFSVPQNVPNNKTQLLMAKYVNIADPLKENNNLGRSICRGNYYRMVSAWQYGAQKLGGLLVSPKDQIANELNEFFASTIDLQYGGRRPDMFGTAPRGLPVYNAFSSMRMSGNNSFSGAKLQAKSSSAASLAKANNTTVSAEAYQEPSKLDSDGSLRGKKLTSDSILKGSPFFPARKSPFFAGASAVWTPKTSYQTPQAVGGPIVAAPASLLTLGEATNRYLLTGSSKFTSPVGGERMSSSSAGRYDGALLAISNLYQSTIAHARMVDAMQLPSFSESLLDLTGNFNLYIISLYYARWQLAFMPAKVENPGDQALAAQLWHDKAADMFALQNTFLHMSANGLLPTQAFPCPGILPMIQPLVSPCTSSVQAPPKPYGTGSYIPNPKYTADGHHLPPRLRNTNNEDSNSNSNSSGKMAHATPPQKENVPAPNGIGSGELAAAAAPFKESQPQPVDPSLPVLHDAGGFRILSNGRLQFMSSATKCSKSLEKGQVSPSKIPLPHQGRVQMLPGLKKEASNCKMRKCFPV